VLLDQAGDEFDHGVEPAHGRLDARLIGLRPGAQAVDADLHLRLRVQQVLGRAAQCVAVAAAAFGDLRHVYAFGCQYVQDQVDFVGRSGGPDSGGVLVTTLDGRIALVDGFEHFVDDRHALGCHLDGLGLNVDDARQDLRHGSDDACGAAQATGDVEIAGPVSEIGLGVGTGADLLYK